MSEKFSEASELTGGRLLALNTIWNIAGQGIPLVVAIVAMPLLIRGLGTDKFGFLTLAWMVIGYFTLFDLGIGRALTKIVAEKLGEKKEQELPALVWTASLLILLLGSLGGVILACVSPWLVHGVLRIPGKLQEESLAAMLILAASIPVLLLTDSFMGVLAARQRFDMINIVQIASGAMAYLVPVAILPFSHSLVLVACSLFIIRLFTLLVSILQSLSVVPILKIGVIFRRTVIRPLLSLGGWMTVSNVVSPLMVSLDRFFIGAIISVSVVAYYTTPFEAVTKLLIISVSLTGVLFPAFAISFVQTQDRATKLFSRGVKYTFLSLFPIILLVVAFAPEGLNLWLGGTFVEKSTRVLQLLAVGVLINSIAQVPFTYIQGGGRPDLTAKLHLVELPLYLAGLWWVTGAYGLQGVAMLWTARITIDTMALFLITRIFFLKEGIISRNSVIITLTAVIAFAAVLWASNVILKVGITFSILLTFIFIAWFFILDDYEREIACKRLRVDQILKRLAASLMRL